MFTVLFFLSVCMRVICFLVVATLCESDWPVTVDQLPGVHKTGQLARHDRGVLEEKKLKLNVMINICIYLHSSAGSAHAASGSSGHKLDII